ncbi:MAG: transcriptional repressor [Terrimicrobiaceae bacterium]
MAAHRNCPRQKAIREVIDDLDGTFTAMQLWRKCRECKRAISRATVYREVRMLREEGYIKDIVLPHGLHCLRKDRVRGMLHHGMRRLRTFSNVSRVRYGGDRCRGKYSGHSLSCGGLSSGTVPGAGDIREM